MGFLFRKEENIIEIKEFKKLLRDSGMIEELNLKLDRIIRAINENENKQEFLEARVARLEEEKGKE